MSTIQAALRSRYRARPHPHPIVTRLTQVRTDLRLSRPVIAGRAEVSEHSIQKWELEGTSPTLNNLTRWADALGYEIVLQRKVAS